MGHGTSAPPVLGRAAAPLGTGWHPCTGTQGDGSILGSRAPCGGTCVANFWVAPAPWPCSVPVVALGHRGVSPAHGMGQHQGSDAQRVAQGEGRVAQCLTARGSGSGWHTVNTPSFRRMALGELHVAAAWHSAWARPTARGTACGTWHIAPGGGTWYMARGTWHSTHHTACGTWYLAHSNVAHDMGHTAHHSTWPPCDTWYTACGTWHSVWHTAHGMWHTVHDMSYRMVWHPAHGRWHMAGGTWHMPHSTGDTADGM